MTLLHILVFTLFALLVGWAFPARSRIWALFLGSLLAVFWLQPATPLRNLDFWLPVTSIALTVWVWAITLSREAGRARENLAAAAVIAGLILALALTRYLLPAGLLTPTRPPGLLPVFLALALSAGVTALSLYLSPHGRLLPGLAILVILGLFIVLKSEPLGQAASAVLRQVNGQDPALASFLDLRWLGFSYLAFRLLHVLRDFQAGKLPAYSLADFVTYALFFPAFTAGPIDRSQRFIAELCTPGDRSLPAPAPRSDYGRLLPGLQRILLGVFKKFVLADTLALFALSGQNAPQVASTGWLWVLLYAFSLRLYLDFSGYTDIALGLGRLLGLTLPENFNAPYLKTNLTTFWNSWHITLAQWFRAYVFNPFTRASRSSLKKAPVWGIILAGQLLTMLLIGLWHGITWNFAAWGLWHGAGLFIHNRWSDWLRGHPIPWAGRRGVQPLLRFGGWVLTFHYVTLGWVWFALPDPGLAAEIFRRLMGIF